MKKIKRNLTWDGLAKFISAHEAEVNYEFEQAYLVAYNGVDGFKNNKGKMQEWLEGIIHDLDSEDDAFRMILKWWKNDLKYPNASGREDRPQ